MNAFCQEEVLRYARHIAVPKIGFQGQERLKSTKVLLIGMGGIGSPASLYLASCGIGCLGLIDPDTIEVSNLQRQILYRTTDLNHAKVAVAKRELEKLNPFCEIQTHPYAITAQNAVEIFSNYDYIVDGSDNYPTRYLVNNACQKAKKILISASLFHFSAQVACFDPYKGPCYQCLYPEPPPQELVPNCSEAGVLGVIPGIAALLAVNQLMMHRMGLVSDQNFFGKLHLFDGTLLSLEPFKIAQNPSCCACQSKDLPQLLPPLSSYGVCMSPIQEISAETLANWIKSHKAFQLIDVREPHEHEECSIESATLIPLGTLVSGQAFIDNAESFTDPSLTLVVHCRSGMRSARAVQLLKDQGFTEVFNLAGGIEAWKQLKLST